MYVGLFFFGAGQGFVASQSSNIIAGAVNARDAQQSSGIQTATRNVGQAIGVAILGVVMLFSITGTFKDAALSSADLSSTSKTVISEQASIGFMPDAAFAKYIADKAANADDAAVLTAINRSTRQNSTQLGLYVLGFICAPVSYTHLRAHETRHDLVCRLLLEKKTYKDNDVLVFNYN